MASTFIQGKGTAKFGPTGSLIDYSDQVTEVTFTPARTTQEIPATFATGETGTEAGAFTRTITISFLTKLAADGFAAEMEDALEDDGEIDFDVWFDSTTAVGTDNPRRTGTMIVDTLDFGGTVGDVRSQTQTYTVKAGTYQKLTTSA